MRSYRCAGAVLIAAGLVLSGCSTDYSDHHFSSAQELVKASGWSCVGAHDKNATDDSLAQYKFDSTPCDDGAVVLYSSDSARADLEAKSWNALKPGECRIDGGNWEVVGTQFKVEDAQKRLGGSKVCAS